MALDLKAKVTELVTKISKDEELQAQFRADPAKAIQSLLGVELPAEQVDQLVAGVKAKLTADNAKGAVEKLKKLF